MDFLILLTSLAIFFIGVGFAISGIIAINTFRKRSDPSVPISAGVASGYYGAITIGGIGMGIGMYSLVNVIKQLLTIGSFFENLESVVSLIFLAMLLIIIIIFSMVSIFYLRKIVSRSDKAQGAATDSKNDAEFAEISLFAQVGFVIGILIAMGIEVMTALAPGGLKKYLYQVLGIILGFLAIIVGIIGLFLYFKLNRNITQLTSSIIYMVVGVLLVVVLILIMVLTGE